LVLGDLDFADHAAQRLAAAALFHAHESSGREARTLVTDKLLADGIDHQLLQTRGG
jgi:hypothetical protein